MSPNKKSLRFFPCSVCGEGGRAAKKKNVPAGKPAGHFAFFSLHCAAGPTAGRAARSAWWARRHSRIAAQCCAFAALARPPVVVRGGWRWPAHPRNRPAVPRLARLTRPRSARSCSRRAVHGLKSLHGGPFAAMWPARPPCGSCSLTSGPPSAEPAPTPGQAAFAATRCLYRRKTGICRYVARPTPFCADLRAPSRRRATPQGCRSGRLSVPRTQNGCGEPVEAMCGAWAHAHAHVHAMFMGSAFISFITFFIHLLLSPSSLCPFSGVYSLDDE